jgi:hypothetical protein
VLVYVLLDCLRQPQSSVFVYVLLDCLRQSQSSVLVYVLLDCLRQPQSLSAISRSLSNFLEFSYLRQVVFLYSFSDFVVYRRDSYRIIGAKAQTCEQSVFYLIKPMKSSKSVTQSVAQCNTPFFKSRWDWRDSKATRRISRLFQVLACAPSLSNQTSSSYFKSFRRSRRVSPICRFHSRNVGVRGTAHQDAAEVHEWLTGLIESLSARGSKRACSL